MDCNHRWAWHTHKFQASKSLKVFSLESFLLYNNYCLVWFSRLRLNLWYIASIQHQSKQVFYTYKRKLRFRTTHVKDLKDDISRIQGSNVIPLSLNARLKVFNLSIFATIQQVKNCLKYRDQYLNHQQSQNQLWPVYSLLY